MPEQIDFYILASTDTTSKLICVCKVVSKAYKQGLKVYVQSENAAQVEALDQLLWSFSPASFIPHTIIDEGDSNCTAPVLIGGCSAPNGWEQLLISLTSAVAADVSRFTRVADFISNNEQDKQSGRDRFKAYRQLGVEPKTHHLDI
jgi:DNA polymerase-3 subunit chi